jgi:aromatic ring hydroxylase
MGLKTGAEFLESLRDGREVWIGGERVDDVTCQPQLRGCANSLAEIYDLQNDPAYNGILTSVSPRTGDPISRAWHLPRSSADLTKGREMFEIVERHAGGVLGRHPQYMASLLMGVYSSRDKIAAANSEWAENVANHFDYCRETDAAVSFSAIAPPQDQRLPPTMSRFLRVVDQRKDGVVVRGAQLAATHTIYGHEYLCTANRRPGQDQTLYFCIPPATPGIKLVCRQPLSHAGKPDHPLASRWDEMDVWIIFDNVLIPHHRIFLLNNDAGVTLSVPYSFGFFYGMLRQVVKDEAMIGICFAVTDYFGTRDQPANQALLAEAVAALESLRTVIRAAEADPVFSAEGLAIPNPEKTAVARVIDLQTHARIVEIVRHICASSLIMAPGEVELTHPTLGPLMQELVAGSDERALERYKLLKLAWDYVCDSFGQRQLLFEEHASVNLARRRLLLLDEYDPEPAIRLAKHLAGIAQPAQDSAMETRLESRMP